MPLKQLQCLSDCRWPSLVLSRKIVERFHFPRLSPPDDRWCNIIGFVPAGSVSSTSTLQNFRDASHSWWLLIPPVYLIDHFPSLQHVQPGQVHPLYSSGYSMFHSVFHPHLTPNPEPHIKSLSRFTTIRSSVYGSNQRQGAAPSVMLGRK